MTTSPDTSFPASASAPTWSKTTVPPAAITAHSSTTAVAPSAGSGESTITPPMMMFTAGSLRPVTSSVTETVTHAIPALAAVASGSPETQSGSAGHDPA